MQIIHSRRRVAAVAAAAAGLALIAGSAALGSHRPAVGLLADATTANEVNFKVRGTLQLKTQRPVRVWQSHLVRDGTPFTSPWHTHPGPEIIAVNEGTVTVRQIARRADDDDDGGGGGGGGGCVPTVIGAGGAYIVPPGVSFQVTTSAVVDLVTTLLLPPDAPISGPGDPC